MTQKKTIVDPDLTDVLSIFKQDLLATMNCVKIGQIQSFDPAKKTAQIKILFKRVLPDMTTVSYPQLVDAPVVTLQGGGGAIQFPIKAGDQCLLFFSDRRLDEWYQNGSESAPGDPRMHDLSDAICLVGVNPLNSSLGTAPTDRVVLSYQGSRFELTATGWNFIGTGSAEIDLTGAIVTIKNNTTTLLTLLDGLIDVVAAITVQTGGTPPLTAASIAALQAQKLVLATLLG